jgi:hypothetical protein
MAPARSGIMLPVDSSSGTLFFKLRDVIDVVNYFFNLNNNNTMQYNTDRQREDHDDIYYGAPAPDATSQPSK